MDEVKAGEVAVRRDSRHAHLVGHATNRSLVGLFLDELVQHGLVIERFHA